jgi:hypothetical protein
LFPKHRTKYGTPHFSQDLTKFFSLSYFDFRMLCVHCSKTKLFEVTLPLDLAMPECKYWPFAQNPFSHSSCWSFPCLLCLRDSSLPLDSHCCCLCVSTTEDLILHLSLSLFIVMQGFCVYFPFYMPRITDTNK